jgi:hypothetical protein
MTDEEFDEIKKAVQSLPELPVTAVATLINAAPEMLKLVRLGRAYLAWNADFDDTDQSARELYAASHALHVAAKEALKDSKP